MAKHWDRITCGKCHLSLKLDEETIKANAEAIKAGKFKKEVVATEEKKEGKKEGKKGGKK